MIEFDVRADNVRELVARLKNIEPKLASTFRKDLKSTATNTASMIQSRIGQIRPPLSNMQYGTARALRWDGAKARVTLSLRGSRKRDVTPLLGIIVDSPKGSPGYIVAETAGSRGPVKSLSGGRSAWGGSTRRGPQGQHLVATLVQRFGPLKGKGGNRIAWGFFSKQRESITSAAKLVLGKFEAEVTRELN